MKIGIILFNLEKSNENNILNTEINNEKDIINNLANSNNNYAIYLDKQSDNDTYYDFSNFNISDIPTDVLWFSDMKKDDLWLSGYLMTHNIKDNMFFNTPLNSIKKMVTSDIEPLNIGLKKLLFIFEKLISMGVVVNNADYDNHISTYSYALSINKNNDNFEINSELKDILPYLYQPTCKIMPDSEFLLLEESGYTPISIKKNGVLYVEKTFDGLSIPTIESHNNFQKLSYFDLVSEIKNYCLSIDKEFKDLQTALTYVDIPYIVNVTGRDVKPSYQKYKKNLENLEITKTVTQHLERSWLTSEEFKILSNFFNFKISNAIFFNKLNEKNILSEYGLSIPQITNVSYFSLITCIFMENLLISFYERNKETEYTNLLYSFLSSKEKKELLVMSIMLIEKGFKVFSYGNNRINILAKNNDEITKLYDFVKNHGFFVV